MQINKHYGRLVEIFSLLFVVIVIFGCDNKKASVDLGDNDIVRLNAPPLGWNSYDCYGWEINDSVIRANMKVFSDKYVGSGYRYFVLDDGWQIGRNLEMTLDSFGRKLPDPIKFPDGLKQLIELAHKDGYCFGVWTICGAPILAAERNLKIKNTDLFFTNEIDTSRCIDKIHGVYHFKSGSKAIQAYYNSVFELYADWQIDFVKYDWITNSPEDLQAVTNARQNCLRPMVLSLSAGGNIANIAYYRGADMVRITGDVWDDRESLQMGFDAWHNWSYYAAPGFWIDLDMIPFGVFPGRNRSDRFTVPQKESFMTLRALSASPRFMGGALIELDSLLLKLTTDSEMLACNQNGIVGKRIKKESSFEIWKTTIQTSSDTGWIGIFNKDTENASIQLSKVSMSLDSLKSYELYDIWRKVYIYDTITEINVAPDGVAFLRYSKR
jgi:hypothetical protein